MDNVFPPSYEEAVAKDYWTIVASYVASTDLCAANLVCRRWHDIFAPYLWGNPARHFTTENDRVYIALTNFRRALPDARYRVRCLTHTLHMPSALWEIYDRPKPEWLRNILFQLPRLQSLVVSGLQFFDHPSLLSLKNPETAQSEADFPLRLLIGAKCENITCTSLAGALLQLPSLAFLDMSETRPARDRNVLSALRVMPGLKVLKLRKIGLRDEEMKVLTRTVGLKLRSLDVRDNRLTDNSIHSLLSNCVHPTKNVYGQYYREAQASIAEQGSSSESTRFDARILENFRREDIDKQFVQTLTESAAGKLASEDLPHVGLTHLYIAKNNVSMEGIASLLRTQNFHVLDIGTVQIAKSLSQSVAVDTWDCFNMETLAARFLAPVLESHTGDNLTYLRVHHAVATAPSPLEDVLSSVAELGTFQATTPASQSNVSGQDSGKGLHRYVGSSGRDTDLPSYEMIDDVSLFSSSNTSRATLNPSPELPMRPRQTLPRYQSQSPTTSSSSLIEAANQSSLSEIGNHRDNLRRRTGLRESTGLIPGRLPSLHTLVLTDVPNTDTPNGMVVSALKRFISTCAFESHLATKQAYIEHPTLYIPGKPRSLHQQHRAMELFGLRRIVLEMATQRLYAAPSTDVFEEVNSGKSKKVETRWNKSSTEDADAERLWDASENDFTFFADERGMRTREIQREGRLWEGTEKNVAAELAKWRTERRNIKESYGQKGGFVEGYWDGEISVVRPESGKVGGSGWYEQFLESSSYTRIVS